MHGKKCGKRRFQFFFPFLYLPGGPFRTGGKIKKEKREKGGGKLLHVCVCVCVCVCVSEMMMPVGSTKRRETREREREREKRRSRVLLCLFFAVKRAGVRMRYGIRFQFEIDREIVGMQG